MVNLTAFAAGSTDQVVNSGGKTGPDNSKVEVSKTIEAVAGQENYFDITLKVTTPKSIEQIVKDQSVAVVVVMDVSNTMVGRKDQNYPNKGDRYVPALKAVKTFMSDFATMSSGSNATRQIGVVGFNTDAHKFAGLTECTSKKEADDLYSKAKSAADNIVFASSYQDSHKRFTNMEAGLKMASDMLAKSKCQYKFIIFVTDGFPTTYIKANYTGWDPYTPKNSGNPGTDGIFYNFITKEWCTDGVSYSDKAALRAQAMATEIKKDAAVKIYSIGVDVSGQRISSMPTYIVDRRKSGEYVIQDGQFTNWLKSLFKISRHTV
ncbi:MAG: VWA domain-containing protein [Oscillospiraceae bacterium]|nr:VWA domain-containing protein [Oscillospiraceae bacterium]